MKNNIIQKIKELIVFFKIWQEVKQSPAIFKVVYDLFKFVETTHEAKKPLVTEIAIFNMADGTKISDFVSIWAGIGDDNPVKRIAKLKLQNAELKMWLVVAMDDKLDEEAKQRIGELLKEI